MKRLRSTVAACLRPVGSGYGRLTRRWKRRAILKCSSGVPLVGVEGSGEDDHRKGSRGSPSDALLTRVLLKRGPSQRVVAGFSSVLRVRQADLGEVKRNLFCGKLGGFASAYLVTGDERIRERYREHITFRVLLDDGNRLDDPAGDTIRE